MNSRQLIANSLLFVVCCLLFTTLVQAHAQLVLAEPANGTTLTESPAEIHLTFNENLGEDSDVTIIGDRFERVSGVVVREIVLNEIFVYVPPLEAGVYTVQYDVISADGHPISGSYEFAVRPPNTTSLMIGTLFGLLFALAIVAFLILRRLRMAQK